VESAPGKYILEVKAEGYQPALKMLKVKANAETRVDFTLKAEPKAPVPITSPVVPPLKPKSVAPAAVTSPVIPASKLKAVAPEALTSPVIPAPIRSYPAPPTAVITPVLTLFPPSGEILNGYRDEDGCPDTLFLGIKGRLLDRRTGQPVEALITINRNEVLEILTTQKGIWIWKSAVPGRYTLKIEAEGYQPQALDFYLLSGQEIILDLRLEPLSAGK
jgi:hypothetical protein